MYAGADIGEQGLQVDAVDGGTDECIHRRGRSHRMDRIVFRGLAPQRQVGVVVGSSPLRSAAYQHRSIPTATGHDLIWNRHTHRYCPKASQPTAC